MSGKDLIKNSKGNIYYGMHFYPGVAQYVEANKEPFTIFLNETTIRKMDPTFAGRPIYVEHVDDVSKDLNDLRKEADGWVVESFFNAADGKHWVKFIVVSDKGERAIKNNFKLSNAYVPTGYGQGGTWNGVTYNKEVTGGEYEHLAIVRNPRYEESVIMTPTEFKAYNEKQQIELKRLANSKTEKKVMGKLSWFKKEKVENEIDMDEMSITLPKSGKERTLVQIVNEADEKAAGLDTVMVGKETMKVSDLVSKFVALKNEMADMKKKKENDEDEEEDDKKKKKENMEDEEIDDMVEKKKKKENKKCANEDDQDQDAEYAKKNKKENDEDEDDMEVDNKKKNKKKNSRDDEVEAARKAYFDLLKNASSTASEEFAVVETIQDRVQLGKSRYGSN